MSTPIENNSATISVEHLKESTTECKLAKTVECKLIKNGKQYYLATADAAQDELAGPFDTLETASLEASKLGLVIKLVKPATRQTKKYIKLLRPGDLFRIDVRWYRVVRHEKDKTTVRIVGGTESSLPSDTQFTELSVLSKL